MAITTKSLVSSDKIAGRPTINAQTSLSKSQNTRAGTSQAIDYSWTKQQEGVRRALDLRLYNQRPYQQLSIKQQVSSLVTTSTTNPNPGALFNGR